MLVLQMTYDQDKNSLVALNNSHTDRDYYRRLESTVLFIDEALLWSKIGLNLERTDQWIVAIERLQFLRNLGQAVLMRVVIASMASTIASIICNMPDKNVWSHRRTSGFSELCCVVCHFHLLE